MQKISSLTRKTVAGVCVAGCLGVSSLAVAADDAATREAEAQAASMALMKQLGGALKQAMSAGGPDKAVSVCRDLAPTLTSGLSREKGWRITRVGTRVRNPLLGMPDSWEQGVLAEFQSRVENGEPVGQLSYSEVVSEPDGRYFRYMKAIGVQEVCLTCHGAREQIAPGVRQMLQTDYPHDRAYGYQVGDLRGAFSIKQPISD